MLTRGIYLNHSWRPTIVLSMILLLRIHVRVVVHISPIHWVLHDVLLPSVRIDYNLPRMTIMMHLRNILVLAIRSHYELILLKRLLSWILVLIIRQLL